MKVNLVFHDWLHFGESIYETEKGIELTLSEFHHGTIFEGEINLDPEHEARLRKSFAEGFNPAFYLIPKVVRRNP